MHKLYYYRKQLYFHYCTIDGNDRYLIFDDMDNQYGFNTCNFSLAWDEITCHTNISYSNILRDISKQLLDYKNNIYYYHRNDKVLFLLRYKPECYTRFIHTYMAAERSFEGHIGEFININDNPMYRTLRISEQDNILELIFQDDINLAASILNI